MRSSFALFACFVVAALLTGCAIGSGSRASLLAGDADMSLVTWRSAKGVTKAVESDAAATTGAVTAEPAGGGEVTVDPGKLIPLLRAAQPPAAPYVAPYSAQAPALPRA